LKNCFCFRGKAQSPPNVLPVSENPFAGDRKIFSPSELILWSLLKIFLSIPSPPLVMQPTTWVAIRKPHFPIFARPPTFCGCCKSYRREKTASFPPLVCAHSPPQRDDVEWGSQFPSSFLSTFSLQCSHFLSPLTRFLPATHYPPLFKSAPARRRRTAAEGSLDFPFLPMGLSGRRPDLPPSLLPFFLFFW